MSRRLFEQTVNNNPSTSKRIAFGALGVITENMTLANFLTWLMNNLSFLKAANNLSDLASAATARDNLGVYSEAETDNLLDTKAPLYPEAGGALGVTNTTNYTPAANYHPATKKYVDDKLIDTGWVACINSLSKPTFSIVARQIGNTVNIMGEMTLNVNAGDVMFELPASIAAPLKKLGYVWYAAGGDYLNIYADAADKQFKCLSEASTSTATALNITYFV